MHLKAELDTIFFEDLRALPVQPQAPQAQEGELSDELDSAAQ
jgi:hypothetical protein